VKILHVTPSYKPAYGYGGPIWSVAALCEYQVAAGHEVTVFCTLANGKTELELPDRRAIIQEGVAVWYFKRRTKDHSHFSPGLLTELFWRIKDFDVVHFHSWWNLVIIPAMVLSRLRAVRPVFSPRGMLGDFTFHSVSKRLFHRLLGRFLLQKVVFHATAEQERAEILRRVPGARVFVLPNIVAFPDFPEGGDQLQRDTFNLIFLSRIHPKKGLDLLFPALAKLPFPWRLSVVGSGDASYKAQLQSLADDLGIAGYIDWHGWLSGEAKYRALQSADAMVLTSYHENFANVVIESLALGTPVLVSDKVGLSDYVAANTLGRVCTLDPEDIAARLCALREDTAQRARVRLAAPGLIRRDFDPERLARKYTEAYGAGY